ncbi:MAG: M1 family metallopeptidase [Actinomycetota bacterium]|nr:M1 family metallopeptidase [Actinomycetota bacterium]
MELDRYRLPRTVEPFRYDLTLQPDLEAATFSGTVEVAVMVHEHVDQVVLNAVELEIDSGTITGRNDVAIAISDVAFDEELQRATLTLAEPVEPGEWVLRLGFRGVLNDQLRGFYRSTYTDDETGETHVIATTQFEAADARRAFPCWDEPDHKAVFGVTLIVPEGLLAISNGPEIGREQLSDGLVRVRFADTMRQSTYLVAFIVGRLEATDPIDVDGVPLRVIHVPGKAALTGFALEAGAYSLRFFRDYYGIAYPDQKMDLIALPDFAAGAMENTGCVTFRESLLLADSSKATQPELENIADVVAHEVAHQWFGNLVTMRWWNGIWLNEAFATFMALLAVEAWRPDWERFASFARSCSAAKEVDALHTTRAIEYPVASPDDTAGMFDILTYQKGGSILRMLERYLGTEGFRDGIRIYLKRHEYANTETHDLWDAIEHATGAPARRIMDRWIWQGGYPLLTVEEAEGGGVHVRQSRFLANGDADTTTWEVPLRVRELGEEESSILAPPEGISLPATGVPVVNARSSSFVRVRYSGSLTEALVARRSELTELERYDLVDDLWAAAVAGAASASDFCKLAERFGDENDLAVWQAILLGLGWCDRFLDGEPREQFRTFVRRLVAPALDRLGWEARDADPDRVRALRGALFQGLGVLGVDPNAAGLAREYEAEGRAGKPIDASLAAAAVNIVAVSGGEEDYERFVEVAKDPPTPQQEQRYLFALPLFRDRTVFDRTLADALESDWVRTQNGPFMLAYSITNRDFGDRGWAFVKEHWDEVEKRFPASLIGRIAEGVRYLTAPGSAEDAAAFFAEHPIPQSAKTLEQILERQRIASELRKRATPDLEAFFAARSSN